LELFSALRFNVGSTNEELRERPVSGVFVFWFAGQVVLVADLDAAE
jgi:hypothetical protein